MKAGRENKRKEIIEDRYRLRKTSIFAWRIHPYKKDDDDDYPFNYNSDNRVLAHDYGPIGPPRKRKRWTSL